MMLTDADTDTVMLWRRFHCHSRKHMTSNWDNCQWWNVHISQPMWFVYDIHSPFPRVVAHALPATTYQLSYRCNRVRTAHSFTSTSLLALILTNLPKNSRPKAITWRQIWREIITRFHKLLCCYKNYYRCLVLIWIWIWPLGHDHA